MVPDISKTVPSLSNLERGHKCPFGSYISKLNTSNELLSYEQLAEKVY